MVNRGLPPPSRMQPRNRTPTYGRSLPRLSPQMVLLISALVIGTILPSWYLNDHVFTRQTYEHLLSGTVGKSAADSFSDTVHRLSYSGYLGSIGVLAVRIVGVSLLLQLALLAFGQDVAFRSVTQVVGWAALAMVLRGVTHTFVLSMARPLSITARDMMIVPWSLADATGQGLSPLDAFAFYNVMNPFEALWCAIIIVFRVKHGVRIRIASGAVATVWTCLLVVQIIGYAYLTHLHL